MQVDQNEQRALLTRAADLEARRQAARASRNVDHEQRLVEELRRLWARYVALEGPRWGVLRERFDRG